MQEEPGAWAVPGSIDESGFTGRRASARRPDANSKVLTDQ